MAGIINALTANVGTFLNTILAFAIVFGILVFIHEFGHFFMAKLVKIRVEVFSFGYGKRLFGFKKGHTDYRVSLIPLGGYVKFLGEHAPEGGKVLEPDNFLAKKRWQRFLVMFMGSVMNILLAVVIFAAINMGGVTVPSYQDEKPVVGWIEPGSPAEKAGLALDDEILRINRERVKTWSDVELAVGTKPERLITVEVRRDGDIRYIDLETEKTTRYEIGYAGFGARILTQVRMVMPGSPAEKAGLRQGDVILAVNGEPVFLYDFSKVIRENPGRELEFLIQREEENVILPITPRRQGDIGIIGIQQGPRSDVKKFAFFPAIAQSIKENARNTFLMIRFLRDLFTGEASTRQLGGPIEIANFSYAAFRMGFMAMLYFIGFISLQLGIINLFPIPVFDGGQIFVLALEGLFRRDFSPRIRQIWIQVGFVIFIFLIGFIILNDIVKRMPNGWESLIPW